MKHAKALTQRPIGADAIRSTPPPLRPLGKVMKRRKRLAMVANVPLVLAGLLIFATGMASADTNRDHIANTQGRGVNVRLGPSQQTSAIGNLSEGAAITIACQTTGDDVNGSPIWDKLDTGGYLSDYYTSTPTIGNFSPGIARCATTPTSPGPASARAFGQTEPTNRATPGQCTAYAKQRFHDATGIYPFIDGDAWQYTNSARQHGWTVTSDPQARSLVVWPANTLGAQGYGHVAWVESVDHRANGTYITISEMNWTYGPGRVDQRTIPSDGRLSYILAP
jgi:surface antigen